MPHDLVLCMFSQNNRDFDCNVEAELNMVGLTTSEIRCSYHTVS